MERDRRRAGKARTAAARPKGGAKTAEAALYRKVAGILRQEIAAGAFPVGANLPPESELCRRFSVSRHTIRQALRQLRDDALVVSRQGAGTIVVGPARKSSYVQTVASIEELIPYAAENRYDVAGSELVTSDTRLAARLGCARGEKWLHITGFRYPPKKSVPICWTEVFIRPQFGAVTKMLARRKGAIYAWIEEIYGERFAEVRQTLRVREVPKELARELKVDIGSSVVEVCRVYRLTTGTVAEIAFNLHPADRFSLSMILHRRTA
jgi:DNA-binding GntR family transcriptional regulator